MFHMNVYRGDSWKDLTKVLWNISYFYRVTPTNSVCLTSFNKNERKFNKMSRMLSSNLASRKIMICWNLMIITLNSFLCHFLSSQLFMLFVYILNILRSIYFSTTKWLIMTFVFIHYLYGIKINCCMNRYYYSGFSSAFQ